MFRYQVMKEFSIIKNIQSENIIKSLASGLLLTKEEFNCREVEQGDFSFQKLSPDLGCI